MKLFEDLETNTQNRKYIVKLTDYALYELDELYNYIFWRLSSPINADNFLERIYSKLENLKTNPYIYSKLSDYSNPNYKYRKIYVNNYIIIYYIEEKEKIVYVIHIFYSKSNYKNRIF